MFENTREALKWYCRRLLPYSVQQRRALAKAFAREPLLTLLQPLIRNGSTAIDVGANTGLYCELFRATADRVIAFEPVPELVAHLRQRFGTTIEVEPVALSDRTSTMTLHIPTLSGETIHTRASLNADANQDLGLDQIDVKVRQLDEYAFEDVGIIKIDVEGHEYAALRGAERTIRKHRPVLVIEIEERHHPGQSWDIIRYVEKLGYDSFYEEEGRLQPTHHFDFDTMQSSANLKPPFGEKKAGPYVNNFIFLAKHDLAGP